MCTSCTPEMNSTGVCDRPDRACRWRQTSKPLPSGSRMSSRTRSGWRDAMTASAACTLVRRDGLDAGGPQRVLDDEARHVVVIDNQDEGRAGGQRPVLNGRGLAKSPGQAIPRRAGRPDLEWRPPSVVSSTLGTGCSRARSRLRYRYRQAVIPPDTVSGRRPRSRPALRLDRNRMGRSKPILPGWPSSLARLAPARMQAPPAFTARRRPERVR